MIPTMAIREYLANIGYSVILDDYTFADVFASSARDRSVPLAAFTHAPPSYRNAALAVIESPEATAPIQDDYRALGAPLLFVIDSRAVTVWQIGSARPRQILPPIKLDQLERLFSENSVNWAPRRIHAAKAFSRLNHAYQLDFVDVGLMPAIEGEIHVKLDRLLNEALGEALRIQLAGPAHSTDQKVLFRTIFRLLAAKVLQDRGHELATTWDQEDIDSVLNGISNYSTLPVLPTENRSFRGTIFESAWQRLRSAINFQNISSDDLAFVYENTLVTPETRALFGTHSTPRSVAEYVVSRIGISEHMKVYEPFAGAGAFLVAALRFLRDLLPVEMTAAARHDLLVSRISGDEIDQFAAEVARLSLILADYPTKNGWVISEVDLFDQYVLQNRAKGADVVLCNPPFHPFTREERLRYPAAYSRSPFKPIAALEGVLDALPSAIGFVLPYPFIDGRKYQAERQRIEKLYKEIEVVALPDRVFNASVIRSSLLIARAPRRTGDTTTCVRSTVIKAADRGRFLRFGEVTDTRTRCEPRSLSGDLWIEDLAEVWEYLTGSRKLGSVVDVHVGLRWRGGPTSGVSAEQKEGFLPGIHEASALHAYSLGKKAFLDARRESIEKRTAALRWPWHLPKLLANAARISRGPWCFAAGVDCDGLLASQQLFGIWPKEGQSLNALCAILNSPLAVAYIASHSPPDRIRQTTVTMVPIPREIPDDLDGLAERYIKLIRQSQGLLSQFSDRVNKLIWEIDATVLRAYDLPPRLEKRVLEYFRGERRPTVHEWTHWFPENFQPFIPLWRYISDEYKMATSGWVLKVFTPLPPDEAAALREYVD